MKNLGIASRATRALRILHVTPSVALSYGGPTASLWGYVGAALEHGAEVTVAAPSMGITGDEVPSPGANIRLFPGWGRGAFVGSLALWSWLRDEGKYFDVIHIHGLLNPISSVSARICRARGWPMVIRPFGTLSRYTFTHRRRLLKRLYFRALDAGNLAEATIHFTTEAELENARDFIGGAVQQFVIPPPWAATLPRPLTAREGPPMLLFVGRVHPVKAIDDLLTAWRFVVSALPTARLVIAGSGEERYMSSLMEQCDASGLTESVRFVGFVGASGKQKLLDSATAFVLPSYHENFGVAALEALAGGLPVVLTPEVALSPLVRENGLGVVTTRDPESLGTAICAALTDESLQRHCMLHGPSVVKEHFSSRVIGTRLLEMYESVRVAITH